ncbi:dopamine N-acetyltransferase-like [Scaptodrosophila lebanonensis]|uniref:aralkylamine N-acetyltransferase n=1 Tax=Drosophila lebanonensis TaxID=7225 RepID=A0A6J2TLQ8_DROLE|nr:dopamine N-acetyltransferase-like [Scaptodrosophila lebanonensis]
MAEEDISIRAMTLNDHAEVKSFLRHNFYTGEPLSLTSDEDVEKCDEEEADDAHAATIEQGYSLVAVNASGRIVGLMLAEAKYPEDVEEHQREAEQMEQHIWGRINRLLSKVEREANIFERYKVSKTLYLHIVSVDASIRGKGLGSRLGTALITLGRAKGFPLLVAYCTSFYAARQLQALGLECIHSQPYADYKDEQGQVVFQTAPPHTELRVMAMRL